MRQEKQWINKGKKEERQLNLLKKINFVTTFILK